MPFGIYPLYCVGVFFGALAEDKKRCLCAVFIQPVKKLFGISIRGPNSVAQKVLFSVSSGVFLLAIRKYWRVEETPDYAKTKAFWVLRSFKMQYFCRYKEKTKQCCRIARLFDAVTAKRGLFKTVLSSTLLCLIRRPVVKRQRHREIAFGSRKNILFSRKIGH